MFVENLCGPAVLYLGFSLTQIIIDLFRKAYNTAIIKSAVAIVFTTVLNMLCKQGLSVISWFIVFIPFVTMTLVTGILLYVFGLAPFTGKLQYSTSDSTLPTNPAIQRNPAEITIQPVAANDNQTTSNSSSFTTHVGKQNHTTTPTTSAAPTNARTSGQTIANSSSNTNNHPVETIGTGVGKIVGDVGQGVGDILGGIGQGTSNIGRLF